MYSKITATTPPNESSAQRSPVRTFFFSGCLPHHLFNPQISIPSPPKLFRPFPRVVCDGAFIDFTSATFSGTGQRSLSYLLVDCSRLYIHPRFPSFSSLQSAIHPSQSKSLPPFRTHPVTSSSGTFSRPFHNMLQSSPEQLEVFLPYSPKSNPPAPQSIASLLTGLIAPQSLFSSNSHARLSFLHLPHLYYHTTQHAHPSLLCTPLSIYPLRQDAGISR